MNCWPSVSPSFAPSSRASGSTEPPGGNGTTSFTGFVGQSPEPVEGVRGCAVAASDASRQAANAAPRRTVRADVIAHAPRCKEAMVTKCNLGLPLHTLLPFFADFQRP